MAARKRKENESFKEYRKALKKEDVIIKAYLSGHPQRHKFLAWLSR